MEKSVEPKCHNKKFSEMTQRELREELAYWQGKIDEAWGGALSAAFEFRNEIEKILEDKSHEN